MKRFHLLPIAGRATIDPVGKQYKRHTGASRYLAAFEACYLLAWGWIPGQARNDVFGVSSDPTHRTIAAAKDGWIIIQDPEVIGNLPSLNRMPSALIDACEGAA